MTATPKPVGARAPKGEPAQRTPVDWLLAEPHRIAFALGAAMLVVCSIWWTAAVFAIWSGHPPRAAIPAIELHGLLMLFAFMPFFFTGFLFTGVPKWLAVPAQSTCELGTGLSAGAAGWAVFFIGARSRDPLPPHWAAWVYQR